MAAAEHTLIKKLNAWYFLGLRDEAKTNLARACQRYHVTVDYARRVRDMPMEQIEQLTEIPECLFAPRVQADQFDTILTCNASGGHAAVVASIVT